MSEDPCDLLIIGGTGWDEPGFLAESEIVELSTPFGEWPVVFRSGRWRGVRVAFLARHGSDHSISPHRVNYRANMWGASQIKPSMLIAINAVGSLNPRMPPASLVLPDQIIDYTWGREHSFVGELDVPMHIDLSSPFDEAVRARIKAADADQVLAAERGVYGVTQGPRLETRAEIRRLLNDGCDLVGMTAMPEAALARELSLAYASLCVVANWAAGIGGSEPISMEEIDAKVAAGRQGVIALLERLLG